MGENLSENICEIGKGHSISRDNYFSIIESLLFVSGEPLTLNCSNNRMQFRIYQRLDK